MSVSDLSKLTCITCHACDNSFWVRRGIDFRANYCAYCGGKFTKYKDADGERISEDPPDDTTKADWWKDGPKTD